MMTNISALLLTQDACPSTTSQVGQSINLISMHGFECEETLMLFSIVLSDRTCGDGQVTKGTMVCKFTNQGFVWEQAGMDLRRRCILSDSLAAIGAMLSLDRSKCEQTLALMCIFNRYKLTNCLWQAFLEPCLIPRNAVKRPMSSLCGMQ